MDEPDGSRLENDVSPDLGPQGALDGGQDVISDDGELATSEAETYRRCRVGWSGQQDTGMSLFSSEGVLPLLERAPGRRGRLPEPAERGTDTTRRLG